VGILTIAVSLLVAQTGQPRSAEEDGRREQFRSVALSYRGNKEAFRFGTVRFEHTKGSSESNDEALAGRFSNASVASGLYVFDGRNSRYEVDYSPEEVARVTTKVSETESRSPLSPVRMLCDGEVTLMDLPFLKAGSRVFAHNPMIHQGTLLFARHFDFPLTIGQAGSGPLDLYGELASLEAGKCSIKEFVSHARLGSADVCKVVLGYGSGERNYWIDLDRGSVPLRILDVSSSGGRETRHEMVNEDLTFVPNAGWLPGTRRFVMQGGKVAQQIRITSVEANQPVLSAFQLDFPEPVGMFDEARKRRYSRRKTWSLLQLPSTDSRESTPATPRSFAPPPEPPEDVTPKHYWAVVLFATALFLLAIVAVRVYWTRGGLPWVNSR
jgi:hypothetical protein